MNNKLVLLVVGIAFAAFIALGCGIFAAMTRKNQRGSTAETGPIVERDAEKRTGPRAAERPELGAEVDGEQDKPQIAEDDRRTGTVVDGWELESFEQIGGKELTQEELKEVLEKYLEAMRKHRKPNRALRRRNRIRRMRELRRQLESRQDSGDSHAPLKTLKSDPPGDR